MSRSRIRLSNMSRSRSSNLVAAGSSGGGAVPLPGQRTLPALPYLPRTQPTQTAQLPATACLYSPAFLSALLSVCFTAFLPALLPPCLTDCLPACLTYCSALIPACPPNLLYHSGVFPRNRLLSLRVALEPGEEEQT